VLLMRVPLEWLHEYTRPELTPAELAERLAMTGTEVERVEHHGVNALEHFVVAKVLERHKHPDADRLNVCMVDVGGSTPSQIVCGAPNVRAGQIVAVARPGAVMPDGSTLGKAKLRGQESNGMILAEDELAIGTDHDGIVVLAGDGANLSAASEHREPLTPGTPLAGVLPIATDVLVLEITQNRPDCLGVYGVAREVHAATGATLAPPPWDDDPGSEGPVQGARITVECPELCPRFTARVFEDVTIAPSPLWLKARLMAAGQRPISNVVDITNYVMLLTGQPLHAFDLDHVAGHELTIRRAGADEPVDTLDGRTRELDEQMVLIADADGPTSIAGVMGGARSEVAADTKRVLMEVATWDGANIHRTSLRLGLRSEASARNEKQLQPEQTLWAQAVATRLMIDLCGARVAPGTIDIGGPGPAPVTIRLRDERIASLLGAPIPRQRCKAILQAIDFGTANTDDGLDVIVPAFRRVDVTREADLIEEVARLDGLEKLPATLPSSRHAIPATAGADTPPPPAYGALTLRQRMRRAASDALAAQGLYEVLGWSFVGAELAQRLRLPDHRAVTLANPMSTEQSQLRTTLLGSLLDIAARNQARGAAAIRLFEPGAVYLPGPEDELPAEPYHLGALLCGPVRPPSWRATQPQDADFFTAKGVLDGLLATLRVPYSVTRATQPFLHPGRAAEIVVDERVVGWLGEIHPTVAAAWELSGTVAGFELDLDAMPLPEPPLHTDLTSFPEVREDLAVVVSERVTAAEVLETVARAGHPLLASQAVFDVYRDAERIGAGNVSLALRFVYRARDRTLTDAEVAAQRSAIVRALESELGGRIRAS
jgi:phenylalanyl-tRNA synthetase beta chain